MFFRKAMLFSKSNLLQSRKVKMIYYKIREGLPNIICKKVLSKEVLGNNFSHFWIIQLRSNENKSIHRCCSEASFSMFRIPQYEWIGQYRQDCLSQASLTAQGYRIRPQMQETQVQSLVQEDPTCRRATKPMRYSCWACAPPEPGNHNSWSPWALEPKKSHCSQKLEQCN